MHMQLEDESVVVGSAKFVKINFGWKKNAKFLPILCKLNIIQLLGAVFEIRFSRNIL